MATRNLENSPVEGKLVVEIPHDFFAGLMHTRWFFGISEPSTVVVTALYNKITPQIWLMVWI